MRSSLILLAVLTAAVSASGCGGGDSSSSTPTTPGTGTTAPTVLTVSIVATKGNQSYVPNPVAKASGEQVMFKNNDTATHRIVMDDNSADFGTLAPGASSSAKAVTTGNFHCTIHPSMVGSINGAAAPDPPPGSGDGY